MFLVALINNWVDIILLAILFSVANKLIQNLVVDTKEYAINKLKSKKLNKEMQELFKQQKVDEAKEKQKESLALMKDQMKYATKPMLYVMLMAFPILYIVKKYYGEIIYDFGIFSVGGLWAYIILGVVVSIVVTNIFDKQLEKKYKPLVENNTQ
jgi:uncharacterized membrane protein (DUF106 family)